MLEQIISKARRIMLEAQQKLSVESAAAIERVYQDIVVLKDFIDRELHAVENNTDLDERSKKAARRGVFEQAGRKLEVIKAKRIDLAPGEALEVKLADKPVEAVDSLLQFLREKEIRDRLVGMTEAQIFSLFGESLFDGSNPLLLNAILNAPSGFEPVSKETIKKIQQTSTRKISTQISGELESVSNLNSLVGEIFSRVKKELDNHRRKELPTALTESRDQNDRPFKF
jgi:hypothetical protein